MAVEFTRVLGKYTNQRGEESTVPLKIAIDKSNSANPPYIVDANNTNVILYQWDSTIKKWNPTGSNDDVLPISLSTGGIAPKYGDFLGINESMFTNNTTAIINKFSDQEKQSWYNSNTYQPYNTWSNRQNADTTNSNTGSVTIDLDDRPNQIEGKKTRNWKGETYVYPEGLRNNQQDYIQFDIIEYNTRRPDQNKGNLLFKQRVESKPLNTIILPIQPSITDSNTVDWNNGQINAVELAAVGLSGQLMNPSSSDDIQNTLSNIASKGIIDNPNAQKAVKLYLQQKAIGINGLLSRFGGAVLNPNMELLFQGPTLRPFTFSFRLSPRKIEEAREVKKIIRAFKESMAVRITTDELFLATPYVYNIRYVNRYNNGSDDHPSINKIKTCALRSCNVDYTPDGSYMTFNESTATMTSYNLTLQFQELEPVTSQDYEKLSNEEIIGY